MNEPRPLLALYKLLWEQIKDENKKLITWVIWRMRDNLILSNNEANTLAHHYATNLPQGTTTVKDKKAFVQRMIKELENDK